MTTRQVPTEAEVLGWMDSLSNWGRWGPDDELGTLNLITPQKRAQAGALVREGISVTCSRLIVPEIAADVTSIPPLHYMIRTGESAPSSGPGGASDFIGLSFHGLTTQSQARELVDHWITVPASDVPDLPPGEFYHFQLLDLRVLTEEGEELGRVTDILETGSNDVYIVSGASGEILVPALADVIRDVDLDQGIMVVSLPDGLRYPL